MRRDGVRREGFFLGFLEFSLVVLSIFMVFSGFFQRRAPFIFGFFGPPEFLVLILEKPGRAAVSNLAACRP